MLPRLQANFIYFITGAAGFVGSNVLRSLLADGQIVHILLKKETRSWRVEELLLNENVHVHFGSLENKKFLDELLSAIKPDVIYHLAARGAYSSQNIPDEIFQTNVDGTINLLEVAKKLPLKLLVNSGSSSEYGNKKAPMKESDSLDPDSFYAVSKCTTTQLCQLYAKNYHVPVVTLRLFSVYGPWEEPSRLMPKLMLALKNKKSIEMVSPMTARDFIYIDDVVGLYRNVELLSHFAGEIFNVGTGRQHTLKETTELAQKVSGVSIELLWEKMPAKSWDKSIWVADMSFTHQSLKWQALTSLEMGLSRMWQWFAAHHRFY